MKVILPHLIKTADLFCNYDINKLTGKGNIKRKYKAKDKKALVNKIFLRYLYILFSDLTENSRMFLFPSKCTTLISPGRLTKEQLIRARKSGAYAELDLLGSNFTCFELFMTYYNRGYKRKIPVRLSHNYRNKMVDKMNKGYKYC